MQDECDPGERIAAAARALLGVPFRLHGRDPATGIDCVGLVLLSLRAAGFVIPEPPPYQLRSSHRSPAMRWAEALGIPQADAARAGDVVIAAIGPMQSHLAVDGGAMMIHAHAGLGKVVEMAWSPEWLLLSRFRIART